VTTLCWLPRYIRIVALAGVLIATAAIGSRMAFAEPSHSGGHGHGAHEPAKPIERGPDYVGDPYPLSTCAVSGAEFAPEGPAAIKDINGREIRFCCTGCAASFAANPEEFLPALDAQIVADQLPHYPLDTCVVSDAKLGSMGDPIDFVYNNRLVRFCCEGCIDEFETNPGEYMDKLNAAVIAKQGANYPLDYCLVLPDEKVGGEGTIDYVVANRLFRLCCEGCKEAINADPAKWISQLDAARE
jgi:YHS domain-containing protein